MKPLFPMQYWVFRRVADGSCLAVPVSADQHSLSVRADGQAFRLLHEQPVSADVAATYIAREGGRLIGFNRPLQHHTTDTRSKPSVM